MQQSDDKPKANPSALTLPSITEDLGDRAVDSHYKATFQLAGSGLARLDLSGRFVDVNQHLCDLLGYSREQLLARRFQDITHPDDIANNNQLKERALRGEIHGYRLEKRYIRSGGDILWADLIVVTERNLDGLPVGFIAVVNDVGSFKQTEARMSFLVEEFAHRSKNLLAVVLSIINQTSAATVADFRQQVRQRIHALAASQNLILGVDTCCACFSDLVAEQLRAFVPSQDPRVDCSGARVELGPNAVRMLGMALHELATNSCKYGALSTQSGRLAISCEIDDARPEQATIRWRESGGPEVVPPTTSGFGRKVIEEMLSRGLNADVVLRCHPQGVGRRWRACVFEPCGGRHQSCFYACRCLFAAHARAAEIGDDLVQPGAMAKPKGIYAWR